MPENDPDPGDLLELTIGPPAHGGHCIARHEGRVVFVRHTLPGERVLARITGRTSRYWRADAEQILTSAEDRVPSVWPQAGPGGVGGGELAHVSLPGQRRWKREVVLDALGRIGRLDPDHPALGTFTVAPVPLPDSTADAGDTAPAADTADAADTAHAGAGGYRTRIELIADGEGRAGMYRHRSHEVLPLDRMPLAHPRIQALDLLDRSWPGGARIRAVAPSDGEPVVLVNGQAPKGNPSRVREVVRPADVPPTSPAEFSYRVRAAGFWQVHAGAPAALVSGVLAAAQLQPGERVWDLYSGAGLLTTPLAAQVGAGGRVDAVEGDPGAAADARRNAHGHDQIVLHGGDVAEHVRHAQQARGTAPRGGGATTRLRAHPDLVVLDPPRTGAGAKVMEAIIAAAPRRIVYVACDPAALARDTATARSQGYELTRLEGLDLFPHTHHVECLATLDRSV